MKTKRKHRIVKPTRFTAARSDASISVIQRRIEKDYHLPKGSVLLNLPSGEPAEPTSKVEALRSQWERFYNPLPFQDCIVEAKLCVYELTQYWDAKDFDRIDLKSSVQVFMNLVVEQIAKECPGATIEWKVSWAKRYQAQGITISTPPTLDFAKSNTLANAYHSVYEDVRLEWDWEIIKPKANKSISKL